MHNGVELQLQLDDRSTSSALARYDERAHQDEYHHSGADNSERDLETAHARVDEFDGIVHTTSSDMTAKA